MSDSKWIYLPDFNPFENEIVYFRRIFEASEGSGLTIKISAEHRYELYVNGLFIQRGPCRGDRVTRYYDTLDLAKHLTNGTNIIAVRTIHYAGMHPCFDSEFGPAALFRKTHGGLMIDGVLEKNGSAYENISTNILWECKKETGIKSLRPAAAMWATNFEEQFGELIDNDFMKLSDEGFGRVWEVSDNLLSPAPISEYGQNYEMILKERPIPFLYEEKKSFSRITKTDCENASPDSLFVPAGSEIYADLDASVLMTAYPYFTAEGKADVTLIYTESYIDKDSKKKKKRDDSSGEIEGECDIFHTTEKKTVYSPFYFRTFRFVRIIVKAYEDCSISDIHFAETGYPLSLDSSFSCDNSKYSQLYDISIRTLQRCMFDTYVDCPYYEQLQYVLDTRLAAMFVYHLTRDDLLTRKAIEDFHKSVTDDGLTGCRAPSAIPSKIPSFSLHHIMMLREYALYRGDADFIKLFLSDITGVLSYFERHTLPNGLVSTCDKWNFIDWVDGWYLSSVVPLQEGEGMTVLTQMYACALLAASELFEYCDKPGTADDYREIYKKTAEAINRFCYDGSRGLYADGEITKTFSVHAQIWAVLCGAVKSDASKEILEKAFADSSLSQVSYSHTYFAISALEKAGLYSLIPGQMKQFIDLTELNLTTWLEDPVTQRSDCHGWGSVPIYYLSAILLGIKPAENGFKSAVIRPLFDPSVNTVSGTVPVPDGSISVSCEKGNDTCHVEINSDIPFTFVYEDGKTKAFCKGHHSFDCKI